MSVNADKLYIHPNSDVHSTAIGYLTNGQDVILYPNTSSTTSSGYTMVKVYVPNTNYVGYVAKEYLK